MEINSKVFLVKEVGKLKVQFACKWSTENEQRLRLSRRLKKSQFTVKLFATLLWVSFVKDKTTKSEFFSWFFSLSLLDCLVFIIKFSTFFIFSFNRVTFLINAPESTMIHSTFFLVFYHDKKLITSFLFNALKSLELKQTIRAKRIF